VVFPREEELFVLEIEAEDFEDDIDIGQTLFEGGLMISCMSR
jgi:hypothetical protein